MKDERLYNLKKRIINGEIDINNTQSFFATVIRGALHFLNNSIKIRDESVSHFMLNTGDDIMYREIMGYQYDPTTTTNEDFIYNTIPRCIVNFSNVSTQPDQLTSPYTRAVFEIEDNNDIFEFSAEMMRMPINMNFELTYYLDNFTDTINLVQYIITNLTYIRTFKIIYMGESIMCGLKMPDSLSVEKLIDINFNTDPTSKSKTVSLDIELTTNIPVFNNKSTIETSAIIANTVHEITNK